MKIISSLFQFRSRVACNDLARSVGQSQAVGLWREVLYDIVEERLIALCKSETITISFKTLFCRMCFRCFFALCEDLLMFRKFIRIMKTEIHKSLVFHCT